MPVAPTETEPEEVEAVKEGRITFSLKKIIQSIKNNLTKYIQEILRRIYKIS